MKNLSLYDKAHLFVSAIRILEYKNKKIPPTSSQVASFLGISLEETLHISRKLEENQIINIFEKSNTLNFTLSDHTVIESLPRKKEIDKLDSEINEFKEKQKNKAKEIEEFQKKQKQKQQELFDKLNKELKKS